MKDNHQLQYDDLPIWLALKIKFEGLTVSNTPWRSSAIHLRDQDDPHDDAHPKRENNAKRQKTSEHRTYVMGESLSGQANENESSPSTSETIDEAKLRKVVDEMLRQRCTSGDEHHVEHWKNLHAKIFYIKRQKEPGKLIKEVYSNSKIVQVIKTYGELGHEHKFITEIIVRRANGSIVSITELDYKNLNKNDIEDMYLLCVNGKVEDYAEAGLMWSLSVFIRSIMICERVHDFQLGVQSYQQKVNLTAPTITFPGIEKYKMFSIVSKLVYGIIYKNNKKENKVMRHQEIHKFRDATLKRVLEGLKSYNDDVKHGYVTPSLSKEDVEYLRLFKE
ncbi:hypothetical protein Tco_0745138 [Tanacetum coccineum]